MYSLYQMNQVAPPRASSLLYHSSEWLQIGLYTSGTQSVIGQTLIGFAEFTLTPIVHNLVFISSSPSRIVPLPLTIVFPAHFDACAGKCSQELGFPPFSSLSVLRSVVLLL